MHFDFGTDEEVAQQARHKLEVWKQAFRLDKKVLYKFSRSTPEAPIKEDAAEAHKSKGKGKPAPEKASPAEGVKLIVRLDFSSHEKITGQRWLERIPTEDPFKSASPKVLKANDPQYAETEQQFEDLA